MRDLSVVAENLRLVQRARRHFLELASVEQTVIYPMLDLMVDDIRRAIWPDDSVDKEQGFEPPDPGGEVN
jgi:hypothetical protein